MAHPASIENLPDWLDHNETTRTRRSTGAAGEPIPWISYPAYSYLEQLDLSQKRVFEYGCGSSTEYFAAHAADVTSVEHDEDWFTEVREKLPANCSLTLAEGDEYVQCVGQGGPYDLIVVDGRWRFDCMHFAVDYLAPNGMLILDNADRYPIATKFVRDKGFIQVDMIGNAPVVNYIFSTSLFISRSFDWPPRATFQPRMLPGMTDSFEARPDYHGEGNKPGAFH